MRGKSTEMSNAWLKVQFLDEKVTFRGKIYEAFEKFIKNHEKNSKLLQQTQYSSENLKVSANPLCLLAVIWKKSLYWGLSKILL